MLAPLVEAGLLRATTDFAVVGELDTINICVPTPLRKTKDPDMSFIVSSCQEIALHFHAGMLVILESTTYPGTTDELVLPILAKNGLEVGNDFFLCFSPERVDPGNPQSIQDGQYPRKSVGGFTAACTEIGREFYAQALDHVVPVSLDAGRGNGEIAREHLPHDQHRPGQRNRDDVRPHADQRLGSD